MEAVQFYFVFVYFFFMASAQNFARAALLFLFFVSFCGVLVVFVTWVRACSPIGAFRDQHARSHARTRPQRGEGDCVLSAASTSCWRHLQPFNLLLLLVSALSPTPPLSRPPSATRNTLTLARHQHREKSSSLRLPARGKKEKEIKKERSNRGRGRQLIFIQIAVPSLSFVFLFRFVSTGIKSARC